jgi:hypothetical protein
MSTTRPASPTVALGVRAEGAPQLGRTHHGSTETNGISTGYVSVGDHFRSEPDDDLWELRFTPGP